MKRLEWRTPEFLNHNLSDIKASKKHTAKLKAIVAIDAIQERGTLKEMSVHYDVSQAMISKWKCIGLIARMV